MLYDLGHLKRMTSYLRSHPVDVALRGRHIYWSLRQELGGVGSRFVESRASGFWFCLCSKSSFEWFGIKGYGVTAGGFDSSFRASGLLGVRAEV